MPSSQSTAEKPPQHKEAPPPQPAFVRPFEDSFQPKSAAPVALRNSHTPPAVLTSPSQAALSLAPPLERTDKVDAAPPAPASVSASPGGGAATKLLLPTSSPSPSASSSLSSSVTLCVPFVPKSPAPPPQQKPQSPQEDSKPPLPPRHDITAVLNVPDKAKVMAAVKESANHNHFIRNFHAQRHAIEKNESTPVTSKLDLAEKRRRDRRLRMNGGTAPHVEERQNHLPIGLLPNGNSIFASSISTGSSDSEQDWDSDGETGSWRQQHLLLTKGPPCKLEVTPQKLFFLQMFGLTTQAKRNDLELAKCEKRFSKHWEDLLPLEVVEEEVDEVIPLPPELPYPSGSPDTLNKSSDYNSKICFLRYLNLEPITHGKRAEREALWQHVLSERFRRKSINSVVLYTSHQNRIKNEVVVIKEAGSPAKEALARTVPKTSAPLTVPRPSPLMSTAAANACSPSLVTVLSNGAVRSQVSKMACLSSATASHRRASTSDDDELPAKVPRWGGLEEVMEAYQRYTKESNLEMCVLREHCQRLHQQLMEGRARAELMDTQLRELVARKNLHDFERHQIQSTLDQLNSCLRKLR